MALINLTPHMVNIVFPDGSVREIPASGQVARLAVKTVMVGDIDGIPLTKSVFGEPEGLPESAPGTLYIVSQLIKSALPKRADLVVPNEAVRDNQGRIVGCRSLGI